MNTLVITLVAAGIIAAVAIIVAVVRAEKKRTEALERASQTLGFTFTPRGDLALLKSTADLPLFSRGRAAKARHMMAGRVDDAEVKLFDFQYTVGGGQHSHTVQQTVVLLPVGWGLPDFVLAPEKFFHRVGQAFGYQDIDFEQNAEFSSRYLLRGRDETAIRAAFGPDRLAFFAGEPGWTVEARSGHLGIYRSGKRCKPENVQSFLADAQRVWQALRTR